MLEALNKAGADLSVMAAKVGNFVDALPVAGIKASVADADAFINRLCDAIDPAEIKQIIVEAREVFANFGQIAENLMEVTVKLKQIADKFNFN